jgi:hypothetical protein
MASLAASLSVRADSLAKRSIEDDLTGTTSPSAEVASSRLAPLELVPQESDSKASAVVESVDDMPLAPTDPPPKSVVAIAPEPSSPAKGKTNRRQVSAAKQIDVRHRPVAGPEGRLEASGERVVKWTLELAPQLIMALNVWERDETKRLGQRVFRERIVDLALDSLPDSLEEILEVLAVLPQPLRTAEGEQFGTRVRISVREKLLGVRPDLRVAGIKNVRIRDIYSAAVYNYLTQLGVPIVVEPERGIANTR